MHVLTGGDSFTAMEPGPKTSWPHYLLDHEVTKCSEMAAGNSLIARNVVNDIYRLSPDVVVIGWSDPNRFEMFFDKDDDPAVYEDLKALPAFSNYIVSKSKGWQQEPYDNPMWDKRPGETSSWLKSGGNYGRWEFGNDHADWKMRLFLKNFHNEEAQYLKTIENILRVQWLCEIKEIPLFNFKAWDHGLFNTTYETSKLLESQINPFTWYSSTLLDFCKEKGFKYKEPVHPPKNYQKLFAQEVIIPWLDKL